MMMTTHEISNLLPNPLTAHNGKASVDGETLMTPASLSAWKAFQAGMQMLQQYASRSPVDIHAVAKSNLQLLHQSLSYDSQYSDIIENTRREGANSNRPVFQKNLYSDQGLMADLLTLQKGTSIHLATLPRRYTLHLLISGSAQLNAENENSCRTWHWWDRIGSNGNKNYLRSGAVIIHSYKQKNSHLTACGKNCLLLRIHVPTIEASRKMAS